MNELNSRQVINFILLLNVRELTLGKSHGGHLGVDGVEDTLIANLRLGDEADLGAQVGNASSGARHNHWSLGLSKTITVGIIHIQKGKTFHKMDDKRVAGKTKERRLSWVFWYHFLTLKNSLKTTEVMISRDKTIRLL